MTVRIVFFSALLMAMVIALVGVGYERQMSFVPRLYETSVHIHHADVKMSCSATIVGRSALLTADHCDGIDGKVEVNGVEHKIHRALHDNNDHTILLLEGVRFDHVAAISSREPEVGDTFSIVGNPEGLLGVFRKGTVSGLTEEDDSDIYMLDFRGGHGDSGAAMYDENGAVVGVISIIYAPDDNTAAFYMMGAYRMGFTPNQLRLARAYDGGR